MNSVHFSSGTDRWATPQRFFDKLNDEFRFTLDVCATSENAKCARYFSPQIDGLKQNWQGVCWMNPPYGREIGRWMRKAHESSLNGTTVVCLVPSRTDTAWWHDYAANASEIRFVRGRLRFGNSKNSAPFPSALIIIRGARPGRETLPKKRLRPGGKRMKSEFTTAVFAAENHSVPRRSVALGRIRREGDVSEAYSALFSAPFSGNAARERLEIKEYRPKSPEKWADGGVAAWAGTTPVLGGTGDRLAPKPARSPDAWTLGGRSRPRWRANG